MSGSKSKPMPEPGKKKAITMAEEIARQLELEGYDPITAHNSAVEKMAEIIRKPPGVYRIYSKWKVFEITWKGHKDTE